LAGTPPRWRADLALVVVTFIWGCTFVLVKEALSDCSTLLFLALRFTLAALVLALIFRPKTGRIAPLRAAWRAGAVAGVLLFSGYVFQTVGLRYTTPSKSAFITGLTIPLVPLIAAVFERKPPRAAELAGVALATAGLGLLTIPEGSLRIGGGDLLTVGCAIAFAAHVVAVGHYAPRLGVQALTLGQVAVSALLAAGTFWWTEPIFIRWTPKLALALLITGLFATALAFSIQVWAQQYTTPTHIAVIFTLEPVFAALTSFLAAGEVLAGRRAGGAALILCGILLSELKSREPAPLG
jgi:drug/metabolite transporter (DMT)-like permease